MRLYVGSQLEEVVDCVTVEDVIVLTHGHAQTRV
jgi:hypothetical protein